MDESKLLKYRDVCKIWGIEEATLYSWVRQKRIPHIRLGNRFVRFEKDVIEKWIASNQVEVIKVGKEKIKEGK